MKNKKLSLILSFLFLISSCNKPSTNELVEEHSHEHEEELEEEIVNYDYEEIIKKPTCTETGEKLVRYGDKEKTLAIAPSGHSFSTGEVIKQPSETEKGIKEYKCVNLGCEEVIREEFELKDSFKAYTEDIIKAATCEEDGLKEYKILKNGVEETIQEVIPALGHNFAEDDSVTKAIVSSPSNTDPGKCKYICSRCKTLSEDTFKMTNRDFFYTESLKKLCKDNMNAYPHIQELFVNIENTLTDKIKEFKKTGEKVDYFSFEVVRNINIAPDKDRLRDVEYYLVREITRLHPEWWQFSPYCNISNSNKTIKGNKMYTTMGISPKDYHKNKVSSSKDSVISRFNSSVKSKFTEGMNELEKAHIIYEYISSKAFTYSMKEIYQKYGGDMVHLIEDGYGVCANYAALFQYMCMQVGIACFWKHTETSFEPIQHAWNWVLIDGKMYRVDVTNHKSLDSDFLTTIYQRDTDEADFGRRYLDYKFSNGHIGSSLYKLYKNGKTMGLYTNLDEALSKIDDSTVDYKIDCNYVKNYVTATNLKTYQRKVECKSLELFCSRNGNMFCKSVVSAPKEFFELNNVIIGEGVSTIIL